MAGVIVLDASVLIALFDPADAQHERAEALFLANAAEQFALSSLTLTEFLIRPTAAGVAGAAEVFIANMGIVVSPLLAGDVRHLAQVRAESGLKLPDAVVLWLAQTSSASVMTLDERLAKAAASVGVDVAALLPASPQN